MDYQETLEWMFQQLPMYQDRGTSAYKADLSNIKKLVTYLGHPEQHLKSVHIAGTNGKGSVSHMLASVLQEAGYKTGLYTSPHLKDFRERIRVNGEVISKEEVVNFINDHQTFIAQHRFSFFELTVGMAFTHFASVNVDIAIIETGLGGRLDSTNVITPELSVITNIGLDHTQILGDTLRAIAQEKAGIIKFGIPVVIGRTVPETKPVFMAKAMKEQSSIHFANQGIKSTYETDLLGNYQKENVATVVKAIEILKDRGWNILEEHIRMGLRNVCKQTGFLGRWQILQLRPKVICDTGHNVDGVTAVISQLVKEDYNKLHMVFGVVKDKILSPILSLLPKNAIYYFTQPQIERGLGANQLQQEAKAFGLEGKKYKTVQIAYQRALREATPDDLIFIGGSTFVVAEVL